MSESLNRQCRTTNCSTCPGPPTGESCDECGILSPINPAGDCQEGCTCSYTCTIATLKKRLRLVQDALDGLRETGYALADRVDLHYGNCNITEAWYEACVTANIVRY